MHDQTDDPLSQVTNERVRAMVRKLREIRGFGPNAGSGLTDRELLEEAFAAKLMSDLEEIRGSSPPLADDGVPDREKLARALRDEPKYRS